MTEFSIDTAAILEPRADRIAAGISKARPDLEILINPDAAPSGRFAVAAFSPGEQLSRFSGASWVHCTGAGTDKLFRALTFTPPVMTRTVGRMGHQMAEYVLAYVLYHAQKVEARRGHAARGEWNKWDLEPRFIHGARAVIFGTGDIGRTIAERLSDFGMVVDGVSRSGTPSAPFRQVVSLDDIESLSLAGVDVVVLALPNLPGTRGIIDAALMSRFRKVQLINVGRGEVLDHEALPAAISAGHVVSAVLDVFPEEPLPPQSPLWRHPQIIVTPHVSGITLPEDAAEAFVEALGRLERGETPTYPVDPEKGY